MERLTIRRPPLLIWMNLAAAALFALTSCFYVLQGKWSFAFVWVMIGLLWLRRFVWARSTPSMEIADGSITAHLSPTRQRSAPLSELASVEDGEKDIVLTLKDGSTIPLPKAQISGGEVEDAVRWLRGEATPGDERVELA